MGTVIAGVVSLCALAIGAIVALALGPGLDDTTTPVITTILAFIAPTVPALIALAKVENVQNDLKNGVIEGPVRHAVNEVLRDGGKEPIKQAVQEALREDHITTEKPWDGVERRHTENRPLSTQPPLSSEKGEPLL